MIKMLILLSSLIGGYQINETYEKQQATFCVNPAVMYYVIDEFHKRPSLGYEALDRVCSIKKIDFRVESVLETIHIEAGERSYDIKFVLVEVVDKPGLYWAMFTTREVN